MTPNSLVDYYAVLGVERFANVEVCHKAWKEKRVAHSPDRVHGMDTSYVNEATRRSKIINEAWDVLSNANRKAEYDDKLRNWTGPISESGAEVVNPFDQSHDLTKLLFGTGETAESSELDDALLHVAGFDPDILEVLSAAYERDPTERNATAFARMLARKEQYLATQQIVAAKLRGVAISEDALRGLGEVEGVAAFFDEVEKKLVSDARSLFRQILAGEVKLLGAGAEQLKQELATDAEAAVARHLTVLSANLEGAKSAVSLIAADRLSIKQMQYQLADPQIRHAASGRTGKVIVVLQRGESVLSFAVVTDVATRQAKVGAGLSDAELQQLLAGEVVPDYPADEWAVAQLNLPAGAEPIELLEYLIRTLLDEPQN